MQKGGKVGLRERLHEYFDDYYFGVGRRRRLKLAIITTSVGLVSAVAILVFVSNNRDTSRSTVGATSPTSLPAGGAAPTTGTSSSSGVSSSAATSPVTPSDTVGVSATDEVSGTTDVVATSASSAVGKTGTSTTSVGSSSSTADPASGPTAPVQVGPYATLPDGQPVPVVAVFDTDTITLTGTVPNQAAVDRLSVLAAANSQTPAYVINNLVVNPAVPINVGVRVIELNSVRFPNASAVVLPEHAKELDRVATVMKALPNVSVLVIGHADQRGTEAGNFAISDERARAVVNYLVFVGVRADRLSSRAVGASDLLAVGNDAASLALNRRTEFIFYGLLIAG